MRNTIAILLLAALSALAAAPAAADVNLVPNLPTGWSWPLVPRPTNDATTTSVPLPATLSGDAASTYFNSAWTNLGSNASVAFRNHSRLDGATVIVDRSCAALAAGAAQQGINGGPFTLPAGRHTLELRVDATNLVAESNEADNNIARQWVWAPVSLAAGAAVTRAAPPERTGGWASIPAGQDKHNNCDGLRFTTGWEWDAVYTWSPDPAVDVDLRYYTPSTGASNGFATALGTSMRAGRGIEAVLTKGVGTLERSYDIGVERAAGAGSYRAQHVTGQYVALGDSITFWFQQDEMLKVFYFAPLFPMQASAWLQTTTEPSVAMGWVPNTALVTGLSELANTTATDAAGRARLDAVVTAAEGHAVVVWRDPDWGTAPRFCGLKIGFAQVDLAPSTPAGWHSPLVPTSTAANSGDPVALPDTLPVTSAGPVYNLALRNLGGADGTDPTEVLITLDGMREDSLLVYAPAAHEQVALYPYIHPGQVRSGRHTVAMELDHEHAQAEATRANNRYGEQYCWGPSWVARTDFPEQPMYPPRPEGGMDLVGDGNGEVLWPNCAGSRLPTAPPTVWWQGYVLKPDFFMYPEIELSLHEALEGTKDGFAEPLGWTMAYDDYTNYMLVNLNRTPRRPFDVGITDWTEYYADYLIADFTAHYVESRTLGTAGILSLAPYEGVGGDDLLQLYEWYFPAGWWMIHIDNLSPYDTIGAAFHHPDEVYTSRPAGAVVSPHYGEDAWLHVYVPTPGWCCVAVFAPDDQAINAMHYQLSMYPGVSAAPEPPALPTVTRLVDASPNPFNPQVAVSFDLAAPGRARLGIFDLKGALVRLLADAELAAGRQTFTWDGRDAGGRALPSGAYVARFEAGEVRQARKLMLVR